MFMRMVESAGVRSAASESSYATDTTSVSGASRLVVGELSTAGGSVICPHQEFTSCPDRSSSRCDRSWILLLLAFAFAFECDMICIMVVSFDISLSSNKNSASSFSFFYCRGNNL